MLVQSQLTFLLNRVLNQPAKTRMGGNELMYHCPFCKENKQIPKLEICLNLNGRDFQKWHCWLCNMGGYSIKSLLKKIGADHSYFQELYKILPESKTYNPSSKKEKIEIRNLPDEYWPLSKLNKASLEYGNALYYLKKRGITKSDIVRYNIGYCERGPYQKRLIFPSYDANGQLNFFTSRTYYDNESNFSKYKNPPWNKNIVGFELFINWNFDYITITEGIFDAISIKRNVIPLFGKTLSYKLKEKLIENEVCRVNVCLDKDAGKESILICEELLSIGIDPHFIELTEKDPSEIGFKKMNELILNSKKVDFSFIINKKINCI